MSHHEGGEDGDDEDNKDKDDNMDNKDSRNNSWRMSSMVTSLDTRMDPNNTLPIHIRIRRRRVF